MHYNKLKYNTKFPKDLQEVKAVTGTPYSIARTAETIEANGATVAQCSLWCVHLLGVGFTAVVTVEVHVGVSFRTPTLVVRARRFGTRLTSVVFTAQTVEPYGATVTQISLCCVNVLGVVSAAVVTVEV